MSKINFEDLRKPFDEHEIEWRISQSGKSGEKIWAKCLAYVQARAIMDRLDGVCGPENWRCSYAFIGQGQAKETGVICYLDIKCDDSWVSKEDGAEQTDFEAFKGGISSALKRAAVTWGIGRYLYGLETGFAKVVNKDTKGAKYAKTQAGDGFWWLPPALPAWALPAEKGSGIKNSDMQPEAGDGEVAGVYTFQYRENAELPMRWETFENLGYDKVKETIVDAFDKKEESGKKLTKNQEELRFRAVEWLGYFENYQAEKLGYVNQDK
jgi:hypothetical protein